MKDGGSATPAFRSFLPGRTSQATAHRPSAIPFLNLAGVCRSPVSSAVAKQGDPPVQEKQPRTFQQVLVRVMAMQLVTLALLGYLQYRYGR